MSVPQHGDRINNYLLEELVGTGSFGQVWRARHHVFDEHVAIKIPTDVQYVQNLRREGVTIHGLRHPNIVRAIDLDPYADPPYLIMEFVPGDSLRAMIDAYPSGLPIATASCVMRGVLNALGVAHAAGVIHRDIKPANILLTEETSAIDKVKEQSVKVADFGLGRVGGVTSNSIAQSGSVLTDEGRDISGTLAYMSPEHKEGAEVDGRSDLYSCGIVLFEMLTGGRPHGAEIPSALRPEVPARLDDVFQRCYTRRDRRFADASAMLDALGERPGAARRPETASAAHCCPSCHGEVKPDDKFCIRCGYHLMLRCSSCHGVAHAADLFCIHCGKDLRNGAGRG